MNRSLRDIIVGALIGAVSMLPGASGGIIAVIFGVYERLVADLADIRGKLLKDLRFLVPLGIGVVLGLLVCAVILDSLIEKWEVLMMFAFTTLILTQIPDIYRLGDDGQPIDWRNMLAFAVGFLFMMSFLFVGDVDGDASGDNTEVFTMLLAGMVVALSKIAPGISGGSILLAMGLYAPLMHAFTEMDMGMLIPAGVGLVLGVLIFSKIIDWCIRNHRKGSYITILGLSVGSVLTVCVDAIGLVSGTSGIVEGVAGAIAGLLIGLLLRKVSVRYAEDMVQKG